MFHRTGRTLSLCVMLFLVASCARICKQPDDGGVGALSSYEASLYITQSDEANTFGADFYSYDYGTGATCANLENADVRVTGGEVHDMYNGGRQRDLFSSGYCENPSIYGDVTSEEETEFRIEVEDGTGLAAIGIANVAVVSVEVLEVTEEYAVLDIQPRSLANNLYGTWYTPSGDYASEAWFDTSGEYVHAGKSSDAAVTRLELSSYLDEGASTCQGFAYCYVSRSYYSSLYVDFP